VFLVSLDLFRVAVRGSIVPHFRELVGRAAYHRKAGAMLLASHRPAQRTN
jgi:hypothetical protein